jgi:hypothetical protein
MEARLTRVEDEIREMKAILGQMLPMTVRIDATLPHLATKADLAQLRSDLSSEIADKPGKLYLWGVLAALLAAYAAGLAAIALIR